MQQLQIDALLRGDLHVRRAQCVERMSVPAKGSNAPAQLDHVLGRSQLMPSKPGSPTTFERKKKVKYNDDLEH